MSYDTEITIGERIREQREFLGMTQAELAEIMGYKSRSSINKIENGTNDIPQSKVVRFAEALNTTVSYLMGWEDNGELIASINSEILKHFDGDIEKALNFQKAVDEDAKNESNTPNNIIPMPKMKKIPLIGTIACGEPILAQENIEDYVNMPANLDCTFALRCKGDSMINARILDGDIAFIREQPEVENGEIAAVMIDNEATLKRVYYYPEKSMLILKPENTAYQDFIYINEELNNIKILGKAIAFLSYVK